MVVGEGAIITFTIFQNQLLHTGYVVDGVERNGDGEVLLLRLNGGVTSTSSPPNKPTHDLILAVKHLLFRSLDSPRKESLSYRRSCFSTVNGKAQAESQPHTRILQGREIGG
ncbi:hypothetical protein P8452_23415 [Trifolium repens]|nr:hypothetical protein P8452_23415 [Trifolium repens]